MQELRQYETLRRRVEKDAPDIRTATSLVSHLRIDSTSSGYELSRVATKRQSRLWEGDCPIAARFSLSRLRERVRVLSPTLPPRPTLRGRGPCAS